MSATLRTQHAAMDHDESRHGFQVSFHDVAFPLAFRPEVPLTEEELLRFCAENKGFEIESDPDGTIRMVSPAGMAGSHLNAYIVRELDAWAEQDGRGLAFGPDLGVYFPDRAMRGPDAAWVSRVRYEALSESEREKFMPFCPEFIVELRSPSDRPSRMEAKMEWWLARGMELGWLIDPRRKLAMIYPQGAEPETLLAPEFLEGEGPVQGFRLKMERFWK